MPTFEEFVQTELPRRPFVLSDGAAGQILMRSTNPLAVRELVWGNIPAGGVGSGAATDAVYTYDLAGENIVGVVETVDGLTRTTTITYNGIGDLNTVAVNYNGITQTDTYSYDGNGNLTGFTSVIT